VEPKKGDVLKAFVVSAVVAAGITILSAPVGDVVARPLPSSTADTITTCKQHPWPYLNCVGTEFGGARVRLISFERATRYQQLLY